MGATTRPAIVVHGASDASEVPGLAERAGDYELRFATSPEALRDALPGAEVLLEWNFAADDLAACWAGADALRWIHWSGAGVDAALFSELVASDVTLTNARGIFDRAMAEYVLALMLAFSKQLPQTLALQQKRQWQHRLTERLDGRVATVVGVGGIGRATSRMLRAVGVRTIGVGRRERPSDLDFDKTVAMGELGEALALTDFLILILPATAQTDNLVDASMLAQLKPGARVINVGRGNSLNENALLDALESGHVSGAALDVFSDEPLASDHRLWATPNVIVSPHMSGDFIGYEFALADAFLDNLQRYRGGEALLNEINKGEGYFVG